MLTLGQASGADVLVFIDMDDVIAPKGLERHLAVLEAVDFSYGDLELVDASGCSLGRRFFDNVWIPDHVDDVVAIRDRNFLGFSNTAVRASRISPVALIVPEDIVAADWWFFTMLMLGGLRGRKTAGPVAAYRLHDANLLGVRAPGTVSAAINQSEAMLRHYRAFSSLPLLAGCAENIEKVLMKLRDLPAQELSECLCGVSFESGVWFEGVGRIAQNLGFVPPVKTI
ncbi:MAG: hypothetical protein HKN28_09770 [Alphaproteobacteria bacterium]|nr:hypothetical protein [Alphaproteobacteria bacterium]